MNKEDKKMHVILVTVGSYGDIAPFLWMGKVLAAGGHSIDFLANPHFEGLICDHGFTFHPIGTQDDYRTAVKPARKTGNRFRDQGERIRASRRLYNAMFLAPVRDTINTIEKLKTPQTVILHHIYGYGARIAAEKFRIPHGNICLSTYWMRPFQKAESFSSRMELAALRNQTRFIDKQLFFKPINAIRMELGLQPVRKSSIEWMFEGQNACLYPDWLQDFGLRDGMQAHLIGFPGTPGSDAVLPKSVSEFITAHPKPIVFTPGTAFENNASFFEEAAAALKKLGRSGIFLTRHKESVPRELPGNILYMDFVPLELLLDQCAAIVHHGGIGTCCQALGAGIPQIIGYRMAEQMENARVMKKQGVCDARPFAEIEWQWLANTIEKLTEQEVLKRCGGIRQKMNDEISEERFLDFLDRLGMHTGNG